MIPTPKLRTRKWRLLIAALVCLNLVLLALSYRHLFLSSETSEAKEERLAYDSELERLPEQIVAAVGEDWRLLVVVFVNTDNPVSRLRYLETVYQRHRRNGLSMIGVSRSTPEQVKTLKERFALSFPLIPDLGAAIHTALHFSVPRFQDGVMLIDSNRRIKYTDEVVPSEDSFRMLVEKYLFGRVDYSYHRISPGDFWRVDGKLPKMQLRDIRTGAETALEANGFAGKTLVIYLAGCAPCRLQGYLANLAHLEKGTTQNGSLTAIFPANFATQDLLSSAQKLQIHSPIFVMAGGSESADDYITRYDNAVNEPFLVTVGKTGLITRINPLDDDTQ